MDVPPGSGLAVGPFLAVDAWLRAAGFSAPAVLAADEARGLVLLEDLGDDLFARLCAAAPGREAGLYAAAVDLLADLQRLPPPARRLDAAALRPRLPAARGAAGARMVPAGRHRRAGAGRSRRGVRGAGRRRLRAVRDAGGGGLPRLPRREPDLAAASAAGHARVGLLDFQDMLVGHPAYDLVSLLEDARRDVAPALRAAMLARYRERSGAEAEALDAAAHVLVGAAQPEDRRPVRAARPPRRQAALPRPPAAGLGHLAAT